MKTRRLNAAYRWGVASRILAASVGGYLVSALAASVLALLLAAVNPGPPAIAVLGTTLGSFVLYTAIVLWVFATRSAARAWAVLGAAALLLGALLLLLKGWP